MRLQAICLLLFACLGLGICLSTQAEIPQRVQIRLFQSVGMISEIGLQGPFQLVQPTRTIVNPGRYRMRISQGGLALFAASRTGKLSSMPLVRASRFILSPIQARGLQVIPAGGTMRQYSGRLEITGDQKQGLRVVNVLPAQEYVTLVVSSETPPGWPMEALKAQAVLTQARLMRYKMGDVLDDTTGHEVYLGRSYWRPEAARAVDAVWGKTLVVRGRPITPFYHASCAGMTSDARIFGNSRQLPGIESVRCPFCRNATFGQPTITTVSAQVFKQAFPGGMPQVLRRDAAFRPLLVRFSNGRTQSGYAFWLTLGQRLGWDKAPGLRYSLAQSENDMVKISSVGAGHGVGLCQHGAAVMARQGKTYRQILRHYFPKATLYAF